MVKSAKSEAITNVRSGRILALVRNAAVWAAAGSALSFFVANGCGSGDTPGNGSGGAGASSGPTTGNGGATGGGTGAGTGGVVTGSGGSTNGSDASVGSGGSATGGSAGTGGLAGTGGGSAGTGGAARDSGITVDSSTKDSTVPPPPPPADGGTGLIWPNDQSHTNSDDWLVTNHDHIGQLQPRVLVIDLENTANGSALVDRHIAALKESSSPHKYKDATAQPAVAYQMVKIVQAPKSGTTVNYASWNTQAFADSNLQIKDPADPNGPNLTLCGLFEKGVINEVWCMASTDPKCGETQEAKQLYSNADPPVKMAGRFVSASNGDNITNLGCKVTARITDFNSGRGTGCHQHAMGHAWERYMDANGAVPLIRKQAARFLNFDLNTRISAPFASFYSACNSNGTQLTDCMIWDSQIAMHSGPSAASTFTLADLSGGCGNAHFYPNTTGTYSYDANTPDPMVLSSCEHYGLHDGTGGKDMTSTFTNAMTDTLYGRSPNPINGACPAAQPACSDDCGGHGTAYLYQNFPGPGTVAKNDDGTPMHNWWVYLFY
jgi:hypothetical protein